ncbi:MAG: hypothetical protein V1706_02930 [Pseudomonadota bacterium]
MAQEKSPDGQGVHILIKQGAVGYAAEMQECPATKSIFYDSINNYIIIPYFHITRF